MTTAERIERNFYEREWIVCWPDRDDIANGYPGADLDALVAAGRMERVETLTIWCPDGHACWVGPPAQAPEYRECNQCDEQGDPEEYGETVEVRYLIADGWKALLKSKIHECEHCGGTGRIIPPLPEAQP